LSSSTEESATATTATTTTTTINTTTIINNTTPGNNLNDNNNNNAVNGHQLRIPALHYKYGDGTQRARLTILYSHGNAEDIGESHDWMRKLSTLLQADILCYDYVGYGLSRGKSSEDLCYQAILSSYWYLTETCKNLPTDIVLFGRSLGSGPTCHLAQYVYEKQKAELKGIILQSPISSAISTVSNFLGKVCSVFDVFQNSKKIYAIKCSVLIIHGTVDNVVPFAHGKLLSEKAPNLYAFLPMDGASHNDIETLYEKKYLDALVVFLGELTSGKNVTVVE